MVLVAVRGHLGPVGDGVVDEVCGGPAAQGIVAQRVGLHALDAVADGHSGYRCAVGASQCALYHRRRFGNGLQQLRLEGTAHGVAHRVGMVLDSRDLMLGLVSGVVGLMPGGDHSGYDHEGSDERCHGEQ